MPKETLTADLILNEEERSNLDELLNKHAKALAPQHLMNHLSSGGSFAETKTGNPVADQLASKLQKLSEHPDIIALSQNTDKQPNFLKNMSVESNFEKVIEIIDSGDEKALHKELQRLINTPAKSTSEIVNKTINEAFKNADNVNLKETEFKNPSYIEKAKTVLADLVNDVKNALGIGEQKSR